MEDHHVSSTFTTFQLECLFVFTFWHCATCLTRPFLFLLPRRSIVVPLVVVAVVAAAFGFWFFCRRRRRRETGRVAARLNDGHVMIRVTKWEVDEGE